MAMLLSPQTNYQTAVNHGVEHLHLRAPKDLALLGADRIEENLYALHVLDANLAVDLTDGRVMLIDDHGAPTQEVGIRWRIIVLHYLAAENPEDTPDWVSFADMPDGRGYEPVYTGRVIRRLCGGAARDRTRFVEAALRLGGQRAPLGDEGFIFQVFPRLPVTVAWYDGDDEFPPNATLLYPRNVLSLLPIEDVIVLSECLVSRLEGKAW